MAPPPLDPVHSAACLSQVSVCVRRGACGRARSTATQLAVHRWYSLSLASASSAGDGAPAWARRVLALRCAPSLVPVFVRAFVDYPSTGNWYCCLLIKLPHKQNISVGNSLLKLDLKHNLLLLSLHFEVQALKLWKIQLSKLFGELSETCFLIESGFRH